MNASETNPLPRAWPLPLRVGFRFLFCYLVLCLVDPTTLSLVSAISITLGIGEALLEKLRGPWSSAVHWVGERMMGVSVSLEPSGSSDTTYEWTNRAACALIALVAAFAWRCLDRHRLRYAAAHRFLRNLLRLHLVLTLLGYASVKAIPLQFGNLGPTDRLIPVGEQSPQRPVVEIHGGGAGIHPPHASLRACLTIRRGPDPEETAGCRGGTSERTRRGR